MSDLRRPRGPRFICSAALLALAAGCANVEPLAPPPAGGSAAAPSAPAQAAAPPAPRPAGTADAALATAFRCGMAPERAARLALVDSSLLDGLAAALAAARAEPGAAPATPPCPPGDPIAAVLAWEVHAIRADGRTGWVDPATERFGVGDRFVIRFATNLPGIVEASSAGPAGRPTRLGTWAITSPTVERAPRAGAIELMQPGEDEIITLSYMPCRFAPAPPGGQSAWSAAAYAALPLCFASPSEIDPRRAARPVAAAGEPRMTIEGRTAYVAMPLLGNGTRGPRLAAPVRLQRRAATS